MASYFYRFPHPVSLASFETLKPLFAKDFANSDDFLTMLLAARRDDFLGEPRRRYLDFLEGRLQDSFPSLASHEPLEIAPLAQDKSLDDDDAAALAQWFYWKGSIDMHPAVDEEEMASKKGADTLAGLSQETLLELGPDRDLYTPVNQYAQGAFVTTDCPQCGRKAQFYASHLSHFPGQTLAITCKYCTHHEKSVFGSDHEQSSPAWLTCNCKRCTATRGDRTKKLIKLMRPVGKALAAEIRARCTDLAAALKPNSSLEDQGTSELAQRISHSDLDLQDAIIEALDEEFPEEGFERISMLWRSLPTLVQNGTLLADVDVLSGSDTTLLAQALANDDYWAGDDELDESEVQAMRDRQDALVFLLQGPPEPDSTQTWLETALALLPADGFCYLPAQFFIAARDKVGKAPPKKRKVRKPAAPPAPAAPLAPLSSPDLAATVQTEPPAPAVEAQPSAPVPAEPEMPGLPSDAPADSAPSTNDSPSPEPTAATPTAAPAKRGPKPGSKKSKAALAAAEATAQMGLLDAASDAPAGTTTQSVHPAHSSPADTPAAPQVQAAPDAALQQPVHAAADASGGDLEEDDDDTQPPFGPLPFHSSDATDELALDSDADPADVPQRVHAYASVSLREFSDDLAHLESRLRSIVQPGLLSSASAIAWTVRDQAIPEVLRGLQAEIRELSPILGDYLPAVIEQLRVSPVQTDLPYTAGARVAEEAGEAGEASFDEDRDALAHLFHDYLAWRILHSPMPPADERVLAALCITRKELETRWRPLDIPWTCPNCQAPGHIRNLTFGGPRMVDIRTMRFSCGACDHVEALAPQGEDQPGNALSCPCQLCAGRRGDFVRDANSRAAGIFTGWAEQVSGALPHIASELSYANSRELHNAGAARYARARFAGATPDRAARLLLLEPQATQASTESATRPWIGEWVLDALELGLLELPAIEAIRLRSSATTYCQDALKAAAVAAGAQEDTIERISAGLASADFDQVRVAVRQLEELSDLRIAAPYRLSAMENLDVFIRVTRQSGREGPELGESGSTDDLRDSRYDEEARAAQSVRKLVPPWPLAADVNPQAAREIDELFATLSASVDSQDAGYFSGLRASAVQARPDDLDQAAYAQPGDRTSDAPAEGDDAQRYATARQIFDRRWGDATIEVSTGPLHLGR